jgi:hypothetical protein
MENIYRESSKRIIIPHKVLNLTLGYGILDSFLKILLIPFLSLGINRPELFRVQLIFFADFSFAFSCYFFSRVFETEE